MLQMRDFTNGKTFKDTNFEILRHKSQQIVLRKKYSSNVVVENSKVPDSSEILSRSKFSPNPRLKTPNTVSKDWMRKRFFPNEITAKTSQLDVPKDQMLRPKHNAGENIKDDHILIPISDSRLKEFKRLDKNHSDK